jgi:hypothetical protein
MPTDPLNGRYLNIREAGVYLGGRSVSWLRSHLSEIPHRRLYDRLLFDPAELRAFVERNAEKRNPIVVDAIVAAVLGTRKRGAS